MIFLIAWGGFIAALALTLAGLLTIRYPVVMAAFWVSFIISTVTKLTGGTS